MPGPMALEEPVPSTDQVHRGAEDTPEVELRAEVAELRQFRDAVISLLTGSSAEPPTGSLAHHANEHSAALTVTAGNLGDLGDTIELLSRNAGEINSVSDESEDAVDDAAAAASDAVAEVHRAQQAVRELSSDLESLQSAIGEVEDMLHVIHRISDQTNMLALNASIEAARVGTAGDGFAVVADEVGELADESKAQAERIESVVETGHSELGESLQSLDSVDEATSDATDAIEASMVELETIDEFVETASRGVDQSASATNDRATPIDGIASTLMEAMNTANQIETALHDLETDLELEHA